MYAQTYDELTTEQLEQQLQMAWRKLRELDTEEARVRQRAIVIQNELQKRGVRV